MKAKFAYVDEEDKSYGLAGIAISLNVWDMHDAVRQISLDDDEAVSFAPEFYICSNPRMSARTAWNQLLQQYKLVMGMTVGNILCREIVLRRKAVDSAEKQAIYEVAEEEGLETCALEADETRALFESVFDRFTAIFYNPQIPGVARKFAAALRQRRVMSSTEIEEELQRCLRL